MTTSRLRILCVDDEPEVLRGLQLHLARHYDVRTATSGAAALEQLREAPDVAVIVSDMRMPGMSGAEFLAKSLAVAPEAQRILLTGDTNLASAIAAVNEGQIFRFLTKPCAPPDLLRAVADAVERFRQRELERSAVRRRVEHQQLQVDPLTGLGSRQRLMAVLEAAAFDESESAWAQVAYFIDIDSSDEPPRHGDQPWGDELAAVIAGRLREHCPATAQIARWGPDQFVVLVPSAGISDEELHARGTQLFAALTMPVPVERSQVKVGATIGVARLMDRLLWQRLIQQAAAASREARGTAGVCLYRHDASPSPGKQRELLHALRESLQEGELTLHYQPIVDVSQGTVRALEALVRWQHPTLGNIEPSVFIPMIEQSGDIVGLGEWVLWTACHEALPFLQDGRLRLTVNVSPRQMLDAGFIPHLEDCLMRSAMPTDALELELTETALAADMDRLREVLDRVRALGVRLAVDDFGTGYSSLSYLNRLPIDTLKVDRVFVQDFYRGGRTIIKAALTVAMDFGQDVIVEGIETQEMLSEIRNAGVSLVQGFCFARPMPSAQLPAWLQAFAADPTAKDTAR